MIAIGVGCRKACPAEDILHLIRTTLAQTPGGLVPDGLFTIVEKRGETGLAQAAAALGLPLLFLDRAVLQRVIGGARSCSQRVEDLYGLPSIAETAALVGAGQGAVLLAPRRSCRTATCAIAGTP